MALRPEVKNEQLKIDLADYLEMKGNDYYCAETNLDVYRIVGYDHAFYIILRHQIVIFKVPIIDKLESMKHYSFIIRHPKVMLNDEATVDGRTVGYINRIYGSINDVFEIRKTSDGELIYDQLQFDEVHCTRTNKADTLGDTFFKRDLSFQIEYSYGMVVLWIQYFGRRMLISSIGSHENYHMNRTLNYSVVHAALVGTSDCVFTLLELDEHNYVHFHHFSRRDIRLGSALQSPPELSLASLLSCSQKIADLQQIKGIFFGATVARFYIFIDRFYLTIDEDIVNERFEIKDKYYANASDLQFADRAAVHTIEYLQSDVRWTNAIGDEIYFSFLERIFIPQFDELDVELVELTETSRKTEWITNCFGQTLRIVNYVYCFRDAYYYLLGSLDSNETDTNTNASHHQIIDMFHNVDVQYDSESSLEFLFDYGDHMFVMVTKNDLFVINRTVAHVRSDTYAIQLSRVYRIENCLLMNCPSKWSRRTNGISLKKSVIVLLAVTLVIVIVVLIVCLVRMATVDQVMSINTADKRLGPDKIELAVKRQNVNLLNAYKQVKVKQQQPSDAMPSNLPSRLIKLIKRFDTRRIARSITFKISFKLPRSNKQFQNDLQAKFDKQMKLGKGNLGNDRKAMAGTKAGKKQKKKRGNWHFFIK